MEQVPKRIVDQLGISQAIAMVLQADMVKSNAKDQGGDGWKQNYKSIDLRSKEFIAEPKPSAFGSVDEKPAKMADSHTKPLAALQNPLAKRPKKASTRANRPKGRGAKLRPNRRRKRQTLSDQGTQSHGQPGG